MTSKRPKKALADARKETKAERSEREIDTTRLKRRLRGEGSSVLELCDTFDATPRRVREALRRLTDRGVMIGRNGDHFFLSTVPAGPNPHILESTADGFYRVGLISDTHLGSTACRYDVLEDAYDWFAAEGISHVYGAGNWIEGIDKGRIGYAELEPGCATWDGQMQNFLERYPQRDGVTSYWVSGADHEGWLQKKEGIDVGRWLEDSAKQAGRDDLVNLGYAQAFIRLQRHGKPRASAKMLIQHPGGGSSYAYSYAPQKRIESAQPGEKPAVWVFGHWHKSGYFNARGVHAILCPSTKDQDVFHMQKGLDSHVGCIILEMRQDERGAIYEVTPRIRRHFDRGYYNHQYELPSGAKRTRA